MSDSEKIQDLERRLRQVEGFVVAFQGNFYSINHESPSLLFLQSILRISLFQADAVKNLFLFNCRETEERVQRRDNEIKFLRGQLEIHRLQDEVRALKESIRPGEQPIKYKEFSK